MDVQKIQEGLNRTEEADVLQEKGIYRTQEEADVEKGIYRTQEEADVLQEKGIYRTEEDVLQ